MKKDIALLVGIGISVFVSVSTMAAERGGGMCTYQACGTCSGETVMMCAIGDLEGCITPICSDVHFPPFGKKDAVQKMKGDLLKKVLGGQRNEALKR